MIKRYLRARPKYNTGYAVFDSDSSIVRRNLQSLPDFLFPGRRPGVHDHLTRMVDAATEIGVLKALIQHSPIENTCSILQVLPIGPLLTFRRRLIFPEGDLESLRHNVRLQALKYVVTEVCPLRRWGFPCFARQCHSLPCNGGFREVPAQLIRPRAPKNGKEFFWNESDFCGTGSASFRRSLPEYLRYKKSFSHELSASAAARLLVAVWHSDSIQNVVNFQFDEKQKYDYDVTFRFKNMTAEKQKNIPQNNDGAYKDILFSIKTVPTSPRRSGKSIILIAAESKGFRQFVDPNNHAGKSISIRVKVRRSSEEAGTQLNPPWRVKITPGTILSPRQGENQRNLRNYIYNYVYTHRIPTETCSDRGIHQIRQWFACHRQRQVRAPIRHQLLNGDEVAAVPSTMI